MSNRVEETPEEQEARIKKWEVFLNSNKESSEKNSGSDTADSKLEIVDDESDGTRSSAGSGDETDEGKQDENSRN